jgi:hypothetical protein
MSSITDGFGLEKTDEVKGEAPFLKGIEFATEKGLELEVVGMEVITPEDVKFGVSHTYGAGGVITKENWLVKTGVCKEGQSLRYNFIKDGNAKYFDNHSVGFFIEMSKAKVESGDIVSIKRTGESKDTKWNISKVKGGAKAEDIAF